MNAVNDNRGNPYASNQEELFERFRELSGRLLPLPLRQAGQAEVLGWDIEYCSGPAVVANVQYQILRRINDFNAEDENPYILDLGANIGLSVLHYKRLYPGARIVAFEPDPEFLPVLKRNLERNGAADVQVVAAAAWIEDGQAHWVSEGVDGSKLIPDETGGNARVDVQTVDLAGFLDRPVDLIKMDIEGAELQVIPHLAGKLAQVKNLTIECHLDQESYPAFGRLITTLAEAGFSLAVNSYGIWQDLVRIKEVAPTRYHQYIAVSAWRSRAQVDSPEWGIIPNADLTLILNKQDQRRLLKESNQQIRQQERLIDGLNQRLEEMAATLTDSNSQNQALIEQQNQLNLLYQELLRQYQDSQALVQYLQQPLYRRAIRKITRLLRGQ